MHSGKLASRPPSISAASSSRLAAAQRLKKRAICRATKAICSGKKFTATSIVPITSPPQSIPERSPLLQPVASASLLGTGYGPGLWPLRERLALASALVDSDNQQVTWPAISRRLSTRFPVPAHRPRGWCSARACAKQYSLLIDSAEIARKQVANEDVASSAPGDSVGPAVATGLSLAELIIKRLTVERVDELRSMIISAQQQHKFLVEMLTEIDSGSMSDELIESFWSCVEATNLPSEKLSLTPDKHSSFFTQATDNPKICNFVANLNNWTDPSLVPTSVWTCSYAVVNDRMSAGIATKTPAPPSGGLQESSASRRFLVTEDSVTPRPLTKILSATDTDSDIANAWEVVQQMPYSSSPCKVTLKERMDALSPNRRTALVELASISKRRGRPSRDTVTARQTLREMADPTKRVDNCESNGETRSNASTASTSVMWDSERDDETELENGGAPQPNVPGDDLKSRNPEVSTITNLKTDDNPSFNRSKPKEAVPHLSVTVSPITVADVCTSLTTAETEETCVASRSLDDTLEQVAQLTPISPPPPPLSPVQELSGVGNALLLAKDSTNHRSLRLRLTRHNGSLTVCNVDGGASITENDPVSTDASVVGGLRLRLALSPLRSYAYSPPPPSISPSCRSPPARVLKTDTPSPASAAASEWERWAAEILDAFASHSPSPRPTKRHTKRRKQTQHEDKDLFDIADNLVLSAAHEATEKRQGTSAARREILVHCILSRLAEAVLSSSRGRQHQGGPMESQLTPQMAERIYERMAFMLDQPRPKLSLHALPGFSSADSPLSECCSPGTKSVDNNEEPTDRDRPVLQSKEDWPKKWRKR